MQHLMTVAFRQHLQIVLLTYLLTYSEIIFFNFSAFIMGFHY